MKQIQRIMQLIFSDEFGGKYLAVIGLILYSSYLYVEHFY